MQLFDEKPTWVNAGYFKAQFLLAIVILYSSQVQVMATQLSIK